MVQCFKSFFCLEAPLFGGLIVMYYMNWQKIYTVKLSDNDHLSNRPSTTGHLSDVSILQLFNLYPIWSNFVSIKYCQYSNIYIFVHVRRFRYLETLLYLK